MNDEECKQFIACLISCFPGFEDSAKSSPNLKQTHRAWAEAWRDLSFEECLSALEGLSVDGNITQTQYREPGPFIRRLVIDRRTRRKSETRQNLNFQQRLERLDSRKKLQSEFRDNKRSLAKALELLSKGVDESKALSHA